MNTSIKLSSTQELETARSFFQDLVKQRKTFKKHRFVAVWTDRITGEAYKVTNTNYTQFMKYVKNLIAGEGAWDNYDSKRKHFCKGFVSNFPEDAYIDIQFDIISNSMIAEQTKKAYAKEVEVKVRRAMPTPPSVVKLLTTPSSLEQAQREVERKARYDEQYRLTA